MGIGRLNKDCEFHVTEKVECADTQTMDILEVNFFTSQHNRLIKKECLTKK